MADRKSDEWSDATQAKCAWALAALFFVWWCISGGAWRANLMFIVLVIAAGLSVKAHRQRRSDEEDHDQEQQT